jgi:hypothetical protein
VRAAVALLLPFAVTACMTPTRMYSADELTAAGRACGLALGELAQEEEEPRLLFFITPNPPQAQRACVQRWAHRRSLHLVLIEGVERVP